MQTETIFWLSGIVFGLSAGFAPGPLMTVLVAETLKHGRKEGFKVAIAPLLTDLPIVLFTLLILSRLPDMQIVLGIISLLGAGFLFYLGYENITFTGLELNVENIKPQSLKKGIITNFLNPHPYVFWFSIGAPTILKAAAFSITAPILYVFFFYICLVGAKMLMAVLTEGSRRFLKSQTYIQLNRILGILLLLFAFLFLGEAMKSFGII